MAQQWHNKHYSTQWGIAILGFFVIATALLIPYLKEEQTVNSHASAITRVTPQGRSCTCQDRNTKSCSGGYYHAGLCPGASNIQCCVPGPIACSTPQGNGKCYNKSGAQSNPCTGGKYVAGHCPGPAEVQCCVMPGSGGSNSNQPQTNNVSYTTATGNTAETPVTGNGNGLLGKYFTWNNFTNGHAGDSPMDQHVDGDINFNWLDYKVPFFGSGIPHDSDFSVEWTGSVLAPLTGMYTFRIVSDDGAELWVNNQRLFSKLQACLCDQRSGQIKLIRNVAAPITVKFVNMSGSAKVQLYWSMKDLSGSTKINETIIPKTQLYSTVSTGHSPN